MGAVEFLSNEVNELSRPGIEPGLLRPQHNALTTRRSETAFLVCVLKTLNFVLSFLMWLMSLVLSLCGFGEVNLSICICSFSLIRMSQYFTEFFGEMNFVLKICVKLLIP